jgi:hypothetical protein
MRQVISLSIRAAVAALAVILTTAQNAAAADKPPAHKPTKPETMTLFYDLVGPKPPATADKVRALGEHLGRALEIALDLFSGNKAELFSNNKAALLSGNSANLLSGNAPKVLSDNTTPILSGNSLSLFSNFKVEIHIENSGNGAGVLPGGARAVPEVIRPRVSRQVEQPSSRTFQPPSIPQGIVPPGDR